MANVDSTKMNEQAQWLEELLAKNTQKWVVVFHHHPIYSTKGGRDNEEWRNKMEPIYKKYKVDFVLQGHDHTYGRGLNMPLGTSRKYPDGPIYVVSVSGPKMYDIGLQDWMDRAASNVQLYQLISVDNNKLTYKAYEATGKLYDAFDLTKDKKGKNKLKNYDESLPAEQLDLPAGGREKLTTDQLKLYESRFEQYMKRKNGGK
jgi:3',5'-cyclic AMP phosphodiesterase CpdA